MDNQLLVDVMRTFGVRPVIMYPHVLQLFVKIVFSDSSIQCVSETRAHSGLVN